MKKTLFFIGTFAALAYTNLLSAADVINDNFESYAGQSAANAFWNGTTENPLEFRTDGGYSSNNYIRQLVTVGARNSKAINMTPSDTDPVSVDFWIRVSGEPVASGVNSRSYIQLEAPGTILINFGAYNSRKFFSYRSLGGVTGGGWKDTTKVMYDGTVESPLPKWSNLKAVVKSRTSEYFIDGELVATETRTSDYPAFNYFRIGFITGGANTPIDFDNVVLSQPGASVEDWNVY